MVSLLADFPTTDIGPWITGFFGVMAGVWIVRQVWLSFFPISLPTPVITIPQPGSEYVTKRELDVALTTLKNDLMINQTHLMEKFDDLRQQSRDLREYTSRSSHEVRNELQSLNILLAQISTAMNCDFVKRQPKLPLINPTTGLELPPCSSHHSPKD